jgi:hypothetical protein
MWVHCTFRSCETTPSDSFFSTKLPGTNVLADSGNTRRFYNQKYKHSNLLNLTKADKGFTIRLKIDFFRLPCSVQYLKIRDGDSLVSELLADFYGGTNDLPSSVTTTDSQMLLEFFSDELASMGESCGGGFLGHAQQIGYKLHQSSTYR